MKGLDTPPAGYFPVGLSRGMRTSARRMPGRTAIVDGPRQLRYAELAERSSRIGNVVRLAWGLAPGDVLLLMAANCLEYPEIMFGLAEQGIIVATVNPRLTAAELALILDDCQPRAAIHGRIDGEAAALLAARQIPVATLGPDYEALLAKASDTAHIPPLPEWASFCLCYTSGTTGTPKGVLLPQRSRALTFLAMASEYGCFGPDDRFLKITPMFHGAGFAFAGAALSFGATLELLNSSDPEQLLTRLGGGDISGIFMVPTHFKRLFDVPAGQARGLAGGHGLKAIISNAAALAQPFKEQAVALFGEGLLHETYGSTEAGVVTNIRPADILRKPGSVGTPFVHMEVEVRREDGSVCAPGETGELFARGPYTFNGYLNRPAETAATLRDGWVTVQDLAVIDEEGFIAIVGRIKDMVVSGGINIYPAEVEAVIARVKGVAEVAVVGMPDVEWGERLQAFVVPACGEAPAREAIVAHCRANLSPYKVPRDIAFLDELPRNPSGKILKRVLREGAGG